MDVDVKEREEGRERRDTEGRGDGGGKGEVKEVRAGSEAERRES